MATKTLIVFSLVVAFVLIASSEGRYTNGGYGNNGGCACIALWDPVCGVNGQTYSNSGCLACDRVPQACTGPCPCWKSRY